MNEWPPSVATRILTGKALPFGPNGEHSAIDKHCVLAPIQLTASGFAGDEQADRLYHGGHDKALHHYPHEHYAIWRRDLPGVAAERFCTGAFGENISTVGLTEQNVCVGDIFRFGTALIQVSQARQPCWKLDVRFAVPNMARLVQESNRTGWYYRVLEPGEAAPSAKLGLIDRPQPDWHIARLLHYIYADPLNAEALAAIAALEVLPQSFRQLAERRLKSGQIEDWSRRLTVPVAAR